MDQTQVEITNAINTILEKHADKPDIYAAIITKVSSKKTTSLSIASSKPAMPSFLLGFFSGSIDNSRMNKFEEIYFAKEVK